MVWVVTCVVKRPNLQIEFTKFVMEIEDIAFEWVLCYWEGNKTKVNPTSKSSKSSKYNKLIVSLEPPARFNLFFLKCDIVYYNMFVAHCIEKILAKDYDKTSKSLIYIKKIYFSGDCFTTLSAILFFPWIPISPVSSLRYTNGRCQFSDHRFPVWIPRRRWQ